VHFIILYKCKRRSKGTPICRNSVKMENTARIVLGHELSMFLHVLMNFHKIE
jgi:hypothetical protein